MANSSSNIYKITIEKYHIADRIVQGFKHQLYNFKGTYREIEHIKAAGTLLNI